MVKKKYNIAIIADPYIQVPPETYGGIERTIAILVEGLVNRGHRVVLWAAPGSKVPCEIVNYGSYPHTGFVNRSKELYQVISGLVKRRKEFDLIHNFGRLAGLLPLLFIKIPKLQSYQRYITAKNIKFANMIAGSSLHFTACSTNCRKNVSHIGSWNTVYNGAEINKYDFNLHVAKDAPLIFLGRIEKIKGPHLAIEAAKKSKHKLIIAGNIPDDAQHKEFFNKYIEPHIDNDSIKYLGPVDDKQKNELLGNSAALLMPILWDEPFGIVMAEALACGTPIIGFNRGSVPEIVTNGINGYICESVDEMVFAVKCINKIDRKTCRNIMEEKFSDNSIVNAYENLYKIILDESNINKEFH